MRFFAILDLLKPKTIKVQMIIMISLLVCLHIAVTAVIFNGMAGKYLEQSHEKRTLDLANTIAKTPFVISALTVGETNDKLLNVISEMEKDTGAKFIVIAKRDGTRLAHPVKERIGKKFVGGDFHRVVEKGESYTSRAVGTLGPSLRGFAPVRGQSGEVLGFVSVGYLETSVGRLIKDAKKEPAAYLFIMLFVGLLAASSIAGYVKKLTLGLEPTEIASLHKEREIILDNVRSGIIAVDRRGRIRFANKQAKRLLSFDGELTGEQIDGVISQAYITQRMSDREEANDEELFINGHIMIFNLITIDLKGHTAGAVISMRRKDEMDYMSSELQQVKQCSELLRVQSHEYSNKLHTISGLLQLEEYDEAKDIILKESEGYHRLVEFTNRHINCPMAAGVILGKYNRAGELKCSFEVDYNGGWQTKPPKPEHIVTILGNLIDNAIDAAKQNTSRKQSVTLGLYEDNEMFYIKVEDSGRGLPNDLNIFQKGVSTKDESRGIGLYNVSMALRVINGEVETGVSEKLGGAYFCVKIGKGTS